MSLAPPAVQPDSTDGRSHRRQIASVLNACATKLFTPNTLGVNTAAGDASEAIACQGGTVLIVGYINLSSGSSFSIKRDSTTLVTLYAPATGQNIPFSWLDTPGAGSFTYTTNSSGHTSAASLSVVELK